MHDAPANVALDDLPGGRHDNDFEDFRSIRVVPTVAEMNSRRPPCLPIRHASDEVDDGDLDAVSGVVLDRQFRILREDLVGPMRDALRELRRSCLCMYTCVLGVCACIRLYFYVTICAYIRLFFYVRCPHYHYVSSKS